MFPLVGSDDLSTLVDAYEWEIPDDLHSKQVSFKDAKKHIIVLGASRVEKPLHGGSHFVVRFEGSRSWPLDRNEDPRKDAFLNQLVPITGYPFEVIKSTLLTGICQANISSSRKLPSVRLVIGCHNLSGAQ